MVLALRIYAWLFDGKPVRIEACEWARLAVALRGVALAGWPVILVQVEKCGLLGPRHRLGAAQRHQVSPDIAAAVDVDGAGQEHGQAPGQGTAYAAARSSLIWLGCRACR